MSQCPVCLERDRRRFRNCADGCNVAICFDCFLGWTKGKGSEASCPFCRTSYGRVAAAGGDLEDWFFSSRDRPTYHRPEMMIDMELSRMQHDPSEFVESLRRLAEIIRRGIAIEIIRTSTSLPPRPPYPTRFGMPFEVHDFKRLSASNVYPRSSEKSRRDARRVVVVRARTQRDGEEGEEREGETKMEEGERGESVRILTSSKAGLNGVPLISSYSIETDAPSSSEVNGESPSLSTSSNAV